MSGSLFRKLLLIFLLITVILTATASIGLSRFFAHYFLEGKQRELLAQGEKINTLVEQYQANRLSLNELKQAVELISYATNSRVYVLNVRGETLTALEARAPAEAVEQDLFHEIRDILKGKAISIQRFVRSLNMPVILVGTPLLIGNQVNGAILFLAPLTAVTESLAAVNRVLWQSSLAIVTVAVLVIFVVSRSITRPIAAMSKAAACVATGDYSQEVPVKGTDETAQLARSFNLMQARLREMERMRQELIADISHELRTPLASIRGFVQGIKDGVIKQEEQPRYLSLVLDETTRLAGLVSDLLELARIQAGTVRLARDKVELAELLTEVKEIYSLAAFEKQITLTTEVDPITLSVVGDRDRLKQVLLNLVSNAIRYTPKGGIISLSAKEDSRGVVISVADTGPGVPEEELTRIFEKFHRLDKSRDTATGGTGLGLAIAKQLINLHGGTVAAQNRVDGPGLVVSFDLPGKNPF